MLHRAGGHQRLLRVEKDVCQRVHANLKVGHVHAHGLLTHRTLVSVTRGLIVVREGNDRGADAEDHGGVDLAVGVHVFDAPRFCIDALPNELVDCHRNHCRLLLLGVHVLDAPGRHEVVPGVTRDFLLVEHLDVLLLYHQMVVFDDEQRPDAPPIIRVQSKLPQCNIMDNANLDGDVELAPEVAQGLHEGSRLPVYTDPYTVDEDLRSVDDD